MPGSWSRVNRTTCTDMGLALGFYSFQDCYPCDGEEILFLQIDYYDKFESLNKAVASHFDDDGIKFIWIKKEDGSKVFLGANRSILHRLFWIRLSEVNKLITESIAEALK